jgi:hypothetical protein
VAWILGARSMEGGMKTADKVLDYIIAIVFYALAWIAYALALVTVGAIDRKNTRNLFKIIGRPLSER